MKANSYIVLILSIYRVMYSDSGVVCSPTGESKQEDPEMIDIDLKNPDLTKVDVLKSQTNSKGNKIVPKDNKIINSVKVGESTIWKKAVDDGTFWKKITESRCFNLLLFQGSNEKMLIVLNTLSQSKRFFINIVYDPTVSEFTDGMSRSYETNKIRYVGLLPFIIELNREFGRLNEGSREVTGTELNIEDKFDRWYYKYQVRTLVAHEVSGRPVLNCASYEPNEKELFVKVTDNYRNIWITKQNAKTKDKFCRRVEIYFKYDNIKLMRLSLVDGSSVAFKYSFIKDRWSSCEEEEFEKLFKEMGFSEFSRSSESVSSISEGKGEGNSSELMDEGGSNSNQGVSEMSSISSQTKGDISTIVGNQAEGGSGRGITSQAKGKDTEKGPEGSQVETKRGESTDAETNTEDLTKNEYNVWNINSDNFYFIKYRISLLRIVTMVPKVKRNVSKLYYNKNDFRYINSDDFTIDYIKWKNSFYFTETVIKNEYEYYSYYLDTEITATIWNSDDQNQFYRNMINEFEYFDIENCIKYQHFDLLDSLSELSNSKKCKRLLLDK